MKEHQGVNDPLGDPKDGHLLTLAIIDTIHEPLIVLDEELRIIAASRSFYKKFGGRPDSTLGKLFYEVSNGSWNIPSLRRLLEQVIPMHTTVDRYEVEHDYPVIGKRTMLVNAREVSYNNGRKKMLLSIFDVTVERALERQKEDLLNQKDMLLREMRHRIANSLQLIASVLLLKAETVNSEESRAHLADAHERIMSIATVQKQLNPVQSGEEIPVAAYLTALCKSLARSMIGGRKPITLEVRASAGSVSSDTAISFGLLTTELVINSLKHAFHGDKPGEIVVDYEINEAGWTLSVDDNGVGETEEKAKTVPRGLGTSIVGALANQLNAIIRTDSSVLGTKVSIIHQSV